MRVFFSAEQGKENTIHMLQKFISEMQEMMDKMEPIEDYISTSEYGDNNKLYWNLSVDFGYRYYKMCIEWAQNAIAQIKSNE